MSGDEIRGIALPLACRFLVAQNVDQQAALERHAGAAHHLGIALVEQHDVAVRVEHAKSLRHVFERGIQHHLLLVQFALGAAVDHRGQQRNADDGMAAIAVMNDSVAAMDNPSVPASDPGPG